MNDNSSYEQRLQAAMERLRALLDPIDGPEKSIADWLGTWDLPTITIVADMIERRVGESPQPAPPSSLERDQQHGDQRRADQ